MSDLARINHEKAIKVTSLGYLFLVHHHPSNLIHSNISTMPPSKINIQMTQINTKLHNTRWK
ncbi:hypothetical protein KP509_31G009500 [Ceratopteris richardii]|uniref:Uncharacterized protein n=1 Tax=Ceratopteris richardii TaxID=49495 RepID=A0A8T2QWT6_CERRI|nr:hypothetical protein KP509_31G009500 [Ceratopteris richardii]